MAKNADIVVGALRSGSVDTLTPSERQTLALLFRSGAQSQSQIADQVNLTQQSASRIINELQQAGMVRMATKAVAGKRGYPSAAVELNGDYAVVAGLAIMADRAALALCNFAGEVVHEVRAAPNGMSVRAVMDWTKEELSHGVVSLNKVAGLGVSVAGSFTGDGPRFNTPYYLNEWAGIDVESAFRERLDIPTYADNDGNAAALAESMLGVGKRFKNFAYLYISAGVGGGVVLAGEVWRGNNGNAGEFAGGLPSTLYPFPSLELLRQIAAKDGKTFETVAAMLDDFDINWPAVDQWIVRVRDSVSIIASNATAILDLEAIVLGGLLPRALAERLIPAIELFDQRRRLSPRPVAQLLPAEAPSNAAAIGAAILPLKAQYFSPLLRAR